MRTPWRIGFCIPECRGDCTYHVRCEAKVMIGGGIRESGCYAGSEVPDAFFASVEQGAHGASFTPAWVDGRNVNVLALFTVLFRSEGGEWVIAVIPNHCVNVPAFGLGYVAPQRYGGNRFSLSFPVRRFSDSHGVNSCSLHLHVPVRRVVDFHASC